MSSKLAMLGRLAVAAIVAGTLMLPAGTARAHDWPSWRDDDEGRRYKHHRHHHRAHAERERHHDRRHLRHHEHRRHLAPRVVIVAPPPVVYMAPPHRHYRHRVAAHPVSPVYLAPGGRYCRDYRASIVIGGIIRIGNCTACLHPDGVWRIVG